MKHMQTKKLVVLSMMAAIAYLLMFFAFPVLPAVPFMKVDFSEIPILIGTYLFGPLAGVIIAFIRSLLHFITVGASIGEVIGNTASFLAALTYVFPTYWLSKKIQGPTGLIGGLALGTISMTVFMCVANYFVITPLYMWVLQFNLGMPLAKYILVGVLPFNLIKGFLVSVVFAILHKKLLPWLSQKTHQLNAHI